VVVEWLPAGWIRLLLNEVNDPRLEKATTRSAEHWTPSDLLDRKSHGLFI
jgi:hypothetical protein